LSTASLSVRSLPHKRARELRHRYLGTEHLLLALAEDSGLATGRAPCRSAGGALMA
jgi:hypothetical protein